jgi:regulator of replication initiation timing
MYNEIKMRCADLNAINQDLGSLSHNNQLFYSENSFLKEELAKQEGNVAYF